MKILRNIVIISIVVACVGIISSQTVYAQLTNEIVLKYPDVSSAKGPGDLVNKIYLYVLSIAGALAVARIVYGGLMVVLNQGAAAKLTDAKNIIKEAIIGLLLLVGAFLILNTINPSLTKLDLKGIGSLGTSSSTGTPRASAPPLEGDLTHNDIMKIFDHFGIRVSSSGGCSDRTNEKCTSFDGFPANGVCQLIYLKYKCEKLMGSCDDMIITAGTEVGHKSHGVGFPVVDFRFANFVAQFDQFVLKAIDSTKDSIVPNQKYTSRLVGGTYMYEIPAKMNPPQKGSTHWHANVGSKSMGQIPSLEWLKDEGTVPEYWIQWGKCRLD